MFTPCCDQKIYQDKEEKKHHHRTRKNSLLVLFPQNFNLFSWSLCWFWFLSFTAHLSLELNVCLMCFSPSSFPPFHSASCSYLLLLFFTVYFTLSLLLSILLKHSIKWSVESRKRKCVQLPLHTVHVGIELNQLCHHVMCSTFCLVLGIHSTQVPRCSWWSQWED